MPQYEVQVGRDARAYFTTKVEAASLEEAKSKLSRHGYDHPGPWTEDGVDEFDNVETCNISLDDEIVAVYSDGDGWTENFK